MAKDDLSSDKMNKASLNMDNPSITVVRREVKRGEVKQTYRNKHGLINYKDTKTKCRLFWCFYRVYRLETVSHVGILDPAL